MPHVLVADESSGAAPGVRRVGAASLLAAAALLSSCLPLGVSFHPDGKRVALVAARGGEGEEKVSAELRVVAIEDGSSTAVLAAKTMGPPCWTADGKGLHFLLADEGDEDAWYLCAWDGTTVRKRARFTLRGEATILLFMAPVPAADGRTVFTTDAVNGRPVLARWDLDEASMRVLADPGGGPSLSPRGDLLAYFAPRGDGGERVDLCVVDLEGEGSRVLVTDLCELKDLPPVPPAWSPDGTRIAVTGEGYWKAKGGGDPLEIVVSDATRGGRRRVSAEGEASQVPVWSRDGKALYYTAETGPGSSPRVLRVLAEGGPPAAVPGGEHAFAVGIAPDGKTLALRTTGRANPEGGEQLEHGFLRLLDPATGEARDVMILDREYRDLAAALLGRAGEDPAANVAAGKAALAVLDRMEKRFPESAKNPRTAALRAAASLVGK